MDPPLVREAVHNFPLQTIFEVVKCPEKKEQNYIGDLYEESPVEKTLHCLVIKATLHLDFSIKSNCTFAIFRHQWVISSLSRENKFLMFPRYVTLINKFNSLSDIINSEL